MNLIKSILFICLNFSLFLFGLFQFYGALTSPFRVAILNLLSVLVISLYFVYVYKRRLNSKKK